MTGYPATVFCKLPGTQRGYYDEEIDVRVSRKSVALAKRAAQKEINEDYEPELRPVRVVWRVDGYLF